MTRVVIIGAGGHGREVADIVRHQAQQGPTCRCWALWMITVAARSHRRCLPVLGDWSWFERRRSYSHCRHLRGRSATGGSAFGTEGQHAVVCLSPVPFRLWP